MSLGIYDAFIFDQSYTMEELTKMIDILRKDVKKPIDVQLHKYVLEKFLYCYYLRGNLSTDEILEMAKEETDYDKKMWLQDTAQGQWRSLYRNMVLYIRGKVRNQTRDNLLESLDYNYRAVLFLFAVEGKILCVYSGNSSIIPILEQQKYLSDFQYWNNTDRPKEISEKDWEKRYYLWEKAIGPDYTIHNHGFMMNLYDTSMELFRLNFPFYRESVPDYDDILYRLMDTLYPDIEGDQWEDKWNELKRNCPKMDMDGIEQIIKK